MGPVELCAESVVWFLAKWEESVLCKGFRSVGVVVVGVGAGVVVVVVVVVIVILSQTKRSSSRCFIIANRPSVKKNMGFVPVSRVIPGTNIDRSYFFF